ncbi:MAG TPA: class F sortase [Dehalococcoidia bacterium]|nr:class F sortase [Dehalococcoidia bacterium]
MDDRMTRLGRLLRNRRALWAAVGGLAALAVAGAVIGVLLAGRGGSQAHATAPTPTATPSPRATPSPTPTATPTPAPTGPGFEGGPAGAYEGRAAETGHRLVIPSIGVDAPVTMRTVPPSGVMGNPNGPWDVTWYDFSHFPGLGGYPGGGGNAVFAGHVDYVNVGPAVFARVATLTPGDVIEVRRADGVVVRYAVESVQRVSPASGDWASILSAEPGRETVTLITCGGTFNPATREYDMRVVVKGVRTP